MTNSASSSPSDNSAALDDQARVATEILSDRLGELQRPLPPAGTISAMQVLMLRDSVDLSCREVKAVTGWAERTADSVPLLSQRSRRKAIIPAAPSVIRLKEITLQTVTALDGICGEPWTREDAGADDFRPALVGEPLDTYMSGRPYLLGVGAAQVQCGRLLMAIDAVESGWGSFHIWIRHPEEASIASLARAFTNREHDAEAFLEDLICGAPGTSRYVPGDITESEQFLLRKALIAEVLWHGGRGPARKYRTVDELMRAARARGRRRQRVRPIELGGAPVDSLDEFPNSEPRAECATITGAGSEIATDLIRAIAPVECDQRFLHLKLVEQMPPREIREEMASLSDAQFAALQHRWNRRLRQLKTSAAATTVATRRALLDAIVRLLSGPSRPK